MKNLVIKNGALYFTVGKFEYRLKPTFYDWILERVEDGMLISDQRAKNIEKQLKKIK